MSKPKSEPKPAADVAASVDLDALDDKLEKWSNRIGASIDEKLATLHKDVSDTVDEKLATLRDEVTDLVDDRVGGLQQKTRDAMAELADHVGIDAGDDLDDDDDDDDVVKFDEDDPETYPEVREARRQLGRECPDDVGEIAKSLRKRGQRMRLHGLRYATAGDVTTGTQLARPVVRRGQAAVRMSGDKNKVWDHKGEMVAQGSRGRGR